MKIVICGSMSSAHHIMDAQKELLQNNHEVVLPRNVEQYVKEETSQESIKNKIKYNLICDYYEEIKKADAILVVNVDKRGIPSYIGGNSFLEMGFAHVLNKVIFVLNEIPDMIYTDEIWAMQPIVLKGCLSKINKQ